MTSPTPSCLLCLAARLTPALTVSTHSSISIGYGVTKRSPCKADLSDEPQPAARAILDPSSLRSEPPTPTRWRTQRPISGRAPAAYDVVARRQPVVSTRGARNRPGPDIDACTHVQHRTHKYARKARAPRRARTGAGKGYMKGRARGPDAELRAVASRG